MLTEPPGSKEIQLLIEALRTHANLLRSRGENEIAGFLEKAASKLVTGPAGEIPLRDFSTEIHHYKGYIDLIPVGISRSEWVNIVVSLRKLTNSALTSSGWSQNILSIIKRVLWPF
jgi:hypothetical protein